MATALISTKDTRVAYEKATGMFMTFYKFMTDIGYQLEEETYDIFAIVGDTLSITQDEESTEEVPHEFSDENLEENTTLGDINFTADCTDYQDSMLKQIYGYKDINGSLVAPNSYKDRYAMIRITFDHSSGQKDVVLPFVKLNSRPVLEGMRTGTATGQITGIAKSRNIVITVGEAPTTVQSANIENTPLVFLKEGDSVSVLSGVNYVSVNITDGTQTSATVATEPTE